MHSTLQVQNIKDWPSWKHRAPNMRQACGRSTMALTGSMATPKLGRHPTPRVSHTHTHTHAHTHTHTHTRPCARASARAHTHTDTHTHTHTHSVTHTHTQKHTHPARAKPVQSICKHTHNSGYGKILAYCDEARLDAGTWIEVYADSFVCGRQSLIA